MATSAGRSVPSDGDPDLAKIVENRDPVELDNVLTVPKAYLDKSPVQLEWQYRFKAMSDTYYQVAYTNTTKGNSKYYLFVSAGHLEAFRNLDTAGGANGNITFNVTRDFQFGQKDKTGKNRFLVYHQSERAVMFQGRFIQAAWRKYGNMASGFIDNFKGDQDSAKIVELIARFLGDPLKKF